MTTRSTPERLDEAVETLLAGERPTVDAELGPLLGVAARLSDSLRPVPPGRSFEQQLARRLSGDGGILRTARELGLPGRPWRLLAAGALSSAALGVTVTAFAVWRSGRRHHSLSQRLLQRQAR
ncbi:MAG TPA: hypothetical protein VF071_09955 [Candidatus Limnocylindria bacterium]